MELLARGDNSLKPLADARDSGGEKGAVEPLQHRHEHVVGEGEQGGVVGVGVVGVGAVGVGAVGVAA